MRATVLLCVWALAAQAEPPPPVPGTAPPSALKSPAAASAPEPPLGTPGGEPSAATPDAPLQNPPWAGASPNDPLFIRPPLTPGKSVGFVGLTTGTLIGSSVLSGVAFAGLYTATFRALGGRPDPVLSGVSGAVAFGLHVLTSQLVTPLSVLAVDEGVVGGVGAARAKGWELSRWALIGSALGLGIYTTGAVKESREGFGAGQVYILAGGATFIVSYFVYTVLDAIGVVRGYEQYRAGIR